MAQIPLEIITDARKALSDVRRFSSQSSKSLKTVEAEASKLNQSFSSLKTIAGAAVAVFAGAKLAQGIKAVVEASATQETAVNQLNTALQLAGDYSVEASNQMQQFASDLQAVTTVGDETSLEMLALAKAFGASNKEAQNMVKAAADLSAATGIELQSAVRNLGKSYSGLAGELGESIPALRELTQEQLKSGEAIQLVLDRFGGAAEAKVNTFSGATQQLSNTWGDLLENIGDLITKNPALIVALKGTTKVIQRFGQFLKDNRFALTSLLTTMLKAVGKVLPIFTQGFQKLNEVVLGSTEAILRAVATMAEWAGADSIANSARGMADKILLAFNTVDTAVEGLTDSTASLAQELENVSVENVTRAIDSIPKEIVITPKVVLDDGYTVPQPLPEMTGPFKTDITATGDEADPNFVGPSKKYSQKEQNDKAAREARLEAINRGASAGASFIDAVAQGAEGTKEAVVGAMAAGISTILDAVLPGIGQALGPFINSFLNFAAQGPEVVKKQIEAFVEAIPVVVEAIAEALPVIAEVLAENADKIILGLARGILVAIRNLILHLDVIIYELIESTAQAITSVFSDLIESILDLPNQIDWEKVDKIFANLGNDIASGFKDNVLGLGGDIANEFKESIKGIGKSITGGNGGVVGKVRGGLEQVGKVFGLATGGIVPRGFPNDTFPAALSSGEMVIPRDDVVSLRRFLNTQQGGNDANTNLLAQILAALRNPVNTEATVTLNQREFAKIILELNRNNRRIA